MNGIGKDAQANTPRRTVAILIGVLVASCVIVLAAIGYEHVMDNLDLYQWQRLDTPSRRTVPFLLGLAVVSTLASLSGIWVAGWIRNAGRAE